MRKRMSTVPTQINPKTVATASLGASQCTDTRVVEDPKDAVEDGEEGDVAAGGRGAGFVSGGGAGGGGGEGAGGGGGGGAG